MFEFLTDFSLKANLYERKFELNLDILFIEKYNLGKLENSKKI